MAFIRYFVIRVPLENRKNDKHIESLRSRSLLAIYIIHKKGSDLFNGMVETEWKIQVQLERKELRSGFIKENENVVNITKIYEFLNLSWYTYQSFLRGIMI